MRKLTRRELLKVSLGTMGALALANLPNWHKPALRVGVLPAHAQASQPRPDLMCTLTWNKGNTEPGGGETKAEDVDLNLIAWEPDGTMVYYGNMNGPTASLDIDNQWGFGPENITVQEGMAASGRYWIGVLAGDYIPYSESPVTVTVKITSFMNSASQQTYTGVFVIEVAGKVTIQEPDVQYPIATVDFQTGVITPWNYPEEVKWPAAKK